MLIANIRNIINYCFIRFFLFLIYELSKQGIIKSWNEYCIIIRNKKDLNFQGFFLKVNAEKWDLNKFAPKKYDRKGFSALHLQV